MDLLNCCRSAYPRPSGASPILKHHLSVRAPTAPVQFCCNQGRARPSSADVVLLLSQRHMQICKRSDSFRRSNLKLRCETASSGGGVEGNSTSRLGPLSNRSSTRSLVEDSLIAIARSGLSVKSAAGMDATAASEGGSGSNAFSSVKKISYNNGSSSVTSSQDVAAALSTSNGAVQNGPSVVGAFSTCVGPALGVVGTTLYGAAATADPATVCNGSAGINGTVRSSSQVLTNGAEVPIWNPKFQQVSVQRAIENTDEEEFSDFKAAESTHSLGFRPDDAEGDGGRQSERKNGLGIIEFLKGKHLLVTGATGFLAKVLVEKILRVQPDVKQIYLLIQPQGNATADQRLQTKVINSPLFQVLKAQCGGQDTFECFVKKKLTAVSGTISNDDLGMDSDLADELASKVDVIVNAAATTAFDERYDVALNINTLGPQRLLNFAHRCPNLLLFMHVSTAFVNGQRQGPTPEMPFYMNRSIAQEMGSNPPNLNVLSEIALAKTKLQDLEAEVYTGSHTVDPAKEQSIERKMQQLGMERAQMFGWQDTYVFTKAMGEMLLLSSQKNSVPVVIIRPSVVESTLEDPFPGWMEGIRMMDPIVLAYGKGQMTAFIADPQGVLDLIPADFVVNAMVAAMAKHAHGSGMHIYQVASSAVNPLTFTTLSDLAVEYFTKHPMLDKDGNPIKLKRMTFIPNMPLFLVYMFLKYQLPVQLSQFLPWLNSGRLSEKRNQILLKTLEQFNHLATIYKPYTFYRGRFEVGNTEALGQELSAEEGLEFGFNIRTLDWADYLPNVHVPGLRKYVCRGRGSSVLLK